MTSAPGHHVAKHCRGQEVVTGSTSIWRPWAVRCYKTNCLQNSQIFTVQHWSLKEHRLLKDFQIVKSSKSRLLSSKLLLILNRLRHLVRLRQTTNDKRWSKERSLSPCLQRTGHITDLKMSSPEALHLVILWACETEEGSEVFASLETHVLKRMILHVCFTYAYMSIYIVFKSCLYNFYILHHTSIDSWSG